MLKSLPLIALLLCASVSAQVYKCPAPGGKVVYSDVPCTGGVNTGIQNVPSETRRYDPANDPNARAAAILQGDREAKDAVRAREGARREAEAQEKADRRAKAEQEAMIREIRDANARKLYDTGQRLKCRSTGYGEMECR